MDQAGDGSKGKWSKQKMEQAEKRSSGRWIKREMEQAEYNILDKQSILMEQGSLADRVSGASRRITSNIF